ncbi:hypothetical protein BCR37DRAFT_411309 [Protomyces lactucae-debilis]|uniref:RING-type domain-containing protein n=1 Tax=Protomyces lactucae-debilis TaxID=2754530 RepID=A0A1Y2FUC1_PROLT|nr:uncharacterized protein BCR37DRAFT_411309 [Protomyces lactucae-debilis]ORY87621.1 hypothetical protein BCR37DRAFT_411309 [Protomyces lactucae-debilis]
MEKANLAADHDQAATVKSEPPIESIERVTSNIKVSDILQSHDEVSLGTVDPPAAALASESQAAPYEEECPICTQLLASPDQEPAKLACSHRFHVACLLDWAQVSTSCPYCRADFTELQVLASTQADAATVRRLPVESKTQIAHYNEEGEEDEGVLLDWFIDDEEYDQSGVYYEPYQPPRCIMCGSSEQTDTLMLCDLCDDTYHALCLGHIALPLGPFYCPTCHTIRGSEITANARSRPVRTVASRRHTRSTRRTQTSRDRRADPTARRTYRTSRPAPGAIEGAARLAEWRRAWRRVRHQASNHLQEPEWTQHAQTQTEALTPAQERERRLWRTRLDSARLASGRPKTAPGADDEKLEDPHTAHLWHEFEKAATGLDRLRVKADATGQSGSRPSAIVATRSPSPPPALEQTSLGESVSRSTKQKRPVRRVSEQVSTPIKRGADTQSTREQSAKRLQSETGSSSSGAYVSKLDGILVNIRRPPALELSPLKITTPAHGAISGGTISPPVASSPAASSSRSVRSSLSSGPGSPCSPAETDPDGYFGHSPTHTDKLAAPVSPGSKSGLTPSLTQAVTKHLVSQQVVMLLQAHYDVQRIDKRQFARINRDVTRAVYSEYAAAVLPDEACQ